MGLLELNAKGLLRASTEEIESGKVRFEDEIGNVVESRRRMLVRNEVLLGAGPPPKMIPTWVPISEVGPDALKPGYPHPILGVPGVKRLFWIEGQKRIEITTPEFDTVFRFEYDELNRRVCAGTIAEDPKHIIYDVDEGRRRMLPSLDASGAELNYLLIPGKDYLVVRRAKLDESGDNYQEICLKLANLDGEILSDIPLTFEGCGERVDPDPEQIIVSQYLMAVWVTDYQRRRIMVFSLSQD